MQINLIEVPRKRFRRAIESGIDAAVLTDGQVAELRRIGRNAILVDGNFNYPTDIGCPAAQAQLPLSQRLNFALGYDAAMRSLSLGAPSETLYKIV